MTSVPSYHTTFQCAWTHPVTHFPRVSRLY